MLRILFRGFSARLSQSTICSRHFSAEPVNNIEDAEREKRIKIYELEMDMLRQEGRKAPDFEKLRPQDWEHILGLPTKTARKKYYQFMWQNEMKRESVEAKKEEKKAANAERLAKQREENAQNEHIVYGLNYNSMFLRIYDATITHFHNMKLIRAMRMNEQKLVIDCSYDQFMNPREASNAGKQLMLCFAENRVHDEPFDLHLCNVNPDNISTSILKRFIPTMYDKDFPLNIHSDSMVDQFDKNKLVYLTPHCNNDLVEYSHDDIYIIGAMVDKTNNDPLSLAKAKKLGLRMARLPLDRYLNWGAGSGKSLTLNQMVSIMLEMKKHGDWERALRIVPRRKILDDEEFARKSFYDNKRNNQASFRRNLNYQDDDERSYARNVDRNYDRNENQSYNRNHDRRNFNTQDNYKNSRQNFNQSENYQRDNKFNVRRIFDENDDFQGNFPQEKSENYSEKHLQSKNSREKKHFDKFKFNLDTWGKKMNQKNKKEDES